MFAKILFGLLVAVGVGLIGFGGYQANASAKVDCCAAGLPCCDNDPCCYPGAACCEAGLPCCDTGSCCTANAKATKAKAKSSCCTDDECHTGK